MIRNYTSSVSAMQSAANIEHRLVCFGARDVMRQYDDKRRLSALLFRVASHGMDFPIRLPAKVAQCEAALLRSVRKLTPSAKQRAAEQAERTAWKLVHEWVDIQLSMVEMGQAEFVELFLPHVWFAGQNETLYEGMKKTGFKQLPSSSAASVPSVVHNSEG